MLGAAAAAHIKINQKCNFPSDFIYFILLCTQIIPIRILMNFYCDDKFGFIYAVVVIVVGLLVCLLLAVFNYSNMASTFIYIHGSVFFFRCSLNGKFVNDLSITYIQYIKLLKFDTNWCLQVVGFFVRTKLLLELVICLISITNFTTHLKNPYVTQ